MLPIIRHRTRKLSRQTAEASLAGRQSRNSDLAAIQLEIVYYPLDKLKLPDRHLRTHSSRQISAIEASIRAFGFNDPIVVDSYGIVVIGVARFIAARNIGLERVPALYLPHLTSEQLRTYRIAEQRLSELSQWDEVELSLELSDLDKLEIDLAVTGFETAEIDRLILTAERGAAEPEDVPPPPPDSPVTRLGDMFVLGNHRLLCGNALERESYIVLLDDERARMAFSDPPYNVAINGHVSGLGRRQHREFAMASGEMQPAAFSDFLHKVFSHCAEVSLDGAIHFQCMDWRHQAEMMAAGTGAYSELKQLIVWVKHSAGMGTFYRSQHELIYVWKVGTAPHVNAFRLGETGRYRTNVWNYEGMSGFNRERDAALTAHPTVKPVAMVADAIRDVSRRGEIVLDPFAGSGTTIIAAERTRRRARCIELDPGYVDVAIQRWEALTGLDAHHVATGSTFAELKTRREQERNAQ